MSNPFLDDDESNPNATSPVAPSAPEQLQAKVEPTQIKHESNSLIKEDKPSKPLNKPIIIINEEHNNNNIKNEIHNDNGKDNEEDDDDDEKDPFLSKLKANPIELNGTSAATGVLERLDDLLDFRGKGPSSTSPQPTANNSINTRGKIIALSSQKLTGVSSQLLNEELRSEIGVPTCMSIGKYIAIGTTHGLVLIFDSTNETLRLILGSGSTVSSAPSLSGDNENGNSNNNDGYGPVTAMDQPTGGGNSDWVLVGYYSGAVTLWDASSGKVVRTVSGGHTSPVNCVRWLCDTRAITVGLRGTSFVHNFGYRLFKVWDEKEPLLDLPGDNSSSNNNSNNGNNKRASVVITAVAPLLPAPKAPWFTDPYALTALSFLDKVFLFGFIPGLASKTALPCKSCISRPQGTPDGALPCLSWRTAAKVPGSGSAGAYSEPLLAVGWGKHIIIAKVGGNGGADGDSVERVFDSLELVTVQDIAVEEHITTITWLNAQTIVYTTARHRIHVIDPFARQEIDCRSVEKMDLVYHGRFVSPRTGAPEACYAPAAERCRARLYLLGRAGIFRLHVLPWEASVNVLVDHGRWLDALAFLLSIHELRERGTFGLPRDDAEVRRVSAAKLLEVLRKFVCVRFAESLSNIEENGESGSNSNNNDNNNAGNGNGNVTAVISKDAEMCAVCMHCALKIAHPDFVFDELYPLLQSTGRTAAFCDSLEPFIAAGRIRLVPTRVLEELLRHLVAVGRDAAAERCVLAVDPIVIDARVNQICLDRHFFTAIMHFRSKRTGNYVAPLNTLLTFLVSSSPHVANNNNNNESASNPLNWKLRPDLATIGRLLLDYITCVMCGCEFPQRTKIVPESRALAVQASICTYLSEAPPSTQAHATTTSSSLLSPSHPRLFYILCMDYRRFLDEGFAPLLAQRSPTLSVSAGALASALYTIIAPQPQAKSEINEESEGCEVTEAQGYVLRFLGARYGAGECDLRPDIARNVIAHLCAIPGTAGDSEKVLMDAIRRALGEGVGTAEEYTRETAAGHLYAVTEWLYHQTRQFGMAVRTRAEDPQRRSTVFALIHDYAGPTGGLSDEELGALKAAALGIAGTLVTTDSSAACSLLLEDLDLECAAVMQQMAGNKALQYRFLRSLYSPEHKRALESKGARPGMDVYERYITLMCEIGRDDVPHYLESCDDYPIDFFMKACQDAHINDGLIILYERAGDVAGAVALLAETLRERLDAYAAKSDDIEKEENSKSATNVEVQAIQTKVRLAVKVCSRNAERVSEEDLSKCWFIVLDTLIGALRGMKAAGKNCEFLTEMTQSVLDSMSGYVATNAILGQIMDDYKNDDFGTFKPIVLGMLESLSFEKRILDSTTHMLQEDVFDSVEMYLHSRKRATALRPVTVCDFCGFNLLTPVSSGKLPTTDVVLFKCGHQYHARCYKKDYCEKCFHSKQSKSQQQQQQLRRGAGSGAGNTIGSSGLTSSSSSSSSATGKSRVLKSGDKYAQRLGHFDNTFRRNKKLSLPAKKKSIITIK